MEEQLKIILGDGDILAPEVIADNHICAELCKRNAQTIKKVIKHSLGSWHIVDYNNVVVVAEIKVCPCCGKKPGKTKRKY